MEKLRQELFNEVEQLQFINLENLENILSDDGKIKFMVLPWHYVKVYYAKYLFVTEYCDGASGEPFFTNNFRISADEMNKIVADNSEKKYLHFFFCNIKLPIRNDLGLIIRFSDIEEYNDNDDESYNSGDNSYFIDNKGNAILLDNSNSFSNIVNEYQSGIGVMIENNSAKQKLTKYITYEMSNIKLFKGFEHDLIFEVICKEEDESKLRIGLVVYIKDKDRIHHTNSRSMKDYYEGYYDAGDLKP